MFASDGRCAPAVELLLKREAQVNLQDKVSYETTHA